MMILILTPKKRQISGHNDVQHSHFHHACYCINIVENGRDKIGWVLRMFQSRKRLEVSRSLMLTLFKSLDRYSLIMEYCCHLWNPWNAKYIQAIEAIHRTFTNKITEVLHLPSWERLHKLKLNSLQGRYEPNIIIYILKMTQHMVLNKMY